VCHALAVSIISLAVMTKTTTSDQRDDVLVLVLKQDLDHDTKTVSRRITEHYFVMNVMNEMK